MVLSSILPNHLNLNFNLNNHFWTSKLRLRTLSLQTTIAMLNL